MLALGLAAAVLVCPFVGGIRGPVVYLLWVGLSWLAADFSIPRLFLARSFTYSLKVATAGALIGLATAAGLLWLDRRYPPALAFVRVLPELHRDMVAGNIAVFILLIPGAHVAHELFYRGFLQQRLSAALRSDMSAILISGLLFAWTHVFVFQSPAYHAAAERAGVAHASPAAHTAVLAYAALESAIGGALCARTGTVVASIAFRAAALIALCLALLPLP